MPGSGEHVPNARAAARSRESSIPGRAWDAIDRLRNTAHLLLRAASVRSGPRSGLYAECETIWHRAEGAASTALLRADFETAIAQLHQAVRLLASPRRAAPGS